MVDVTSQIRSFGPSQPNPDANYLIQDTGADRPCSSNLNRRDCSTTGVDGERGMQEEQPVEIGGLAVRLAGASTVPEGSLFGREDILKTCRLMWGLDENWRPRNPPVEALPFRLVGPPGVGKNAVVNEVMRRIRQGNSPAPPFYVIQCHEEMTPEDLAMSWGPAAHSTGGPDGGATRWILKASGLATAVHEGGVVFLDEINRAPPRCLSVLVPVLDDRREIYSAMTNTWISRRPDARFPFLFCCAMNPNAGDTAYPLPENIKQRTLPIIKLKALDPKDMLDVIKSTLGGTFDCTPIMQEFEAAVAEGVSLRILLRSLEQWRREDLGPERLSAILAEARAR